MRNNVLLAGGVGCTLAGLLCALWPLAFFGLLLVVLSGWWLPAVLLGFLLDLSYGTPGGHLAFLLLPFTLMAAIGSFATAQAVRSMREAAIDRL